MLYNTSKLHSRTVMFARNPTNAPVKAFCTQIYEIMMQNVSLYTCGDI